MLRKYKSTVFYNIKLKNRIFKNIPSNQVIGILKNRNIIDLEKLFNDKEQENKLWYDDGNDWVYSPKYRTKDLKRILKYFNVEDLVEKVGDSDEKL